MQGKQLHIITSNVTHNHYYSLLFLGCFEQCWLFLLLDKTGFSHNKNNMMKQNETPKKTLKSSSLLVLITHYKKKRRQCDVLVLRAQSGL